MNNKTSTSSHRHCWVFSNLVTEVGFGEDCAFFTVLLYVILEFLLALAKTLTNSTNCIQNPYQYAV